ncbi:PREDICTED: uncharacterized protein LOC107333851 [Acropora digitifera]|uniref:uncharacterized protein LOC107333851 n=1 Tax=Acropora digitifera TaxID=70779 RepID=UPI000779FFBF|nr:PREDICTED: uncharacterized protein LOC107333851 [Acropora digitifera]
MAQCYKRKVRLSFDSDFTSPEGKKICESPRSDPNIITVSEEGEDDQVLEALNMTERIASQLEMICQTLASVENRLLERFSDLERSVNNLHIELKTLSEKSRIIEEKANEFEKAMDFENAELEGLKKKDKKNEDKIKELEDKLLYQEVYNRRENLRFFGGIPESPTSVQNTFSVMHNFLKEELNLENAENIEFQRAHRIGKKKPGETRPVIVRFLKFPEREMVFRRERELEGETDVKVYSDLPKEISERRK